MSAAAWFIGGGAVGWLVALVTLYLGVRIEASDERVEAEAEALQLADAWERRVHRGSGAGKRSTYRICAGELRRMAMTLRGGKGGA